MSMKLTPAYSSFTKASPARGAGSGISKSCRFSGPPNAAMAIAFTPQVLSGSRRRGDAGFAGQRVEQISLEAGCIELRRIVGLQPHGTIAEIERVPKKRRARLQETVHFAGVVDLARGDAALHPTAGITGDAVAKDRLHTELPNALDRF